MPEPAFRKTIKERKSNYKTRKQINTASTANERNRQENKTRQQQDKLNKKTKNE